MIDVLKVFCLAFHLLAMNLASAGPIAALLFMSRKGSGECSKNNVARRLIWQSLAALAVGVAFGAVLWLLSDEAYLAALGRFDAMAYWYAASELLFSAVCMALMAWSVRKWPSNRWAAGVLALLSVTNLWYHFPPFMTVLGKLASNPSWSPLEVIPRKELLRLMSSPEVLALSVHFALASLTTAAVFAIWSTADESDSLEIAPARQKAAWLALVVTAIQLCVGLWVLTALEGSTRDALLGGNLWGTASFAAAVIGTLLLLERLATVAFGESDAAASRRAGILLIAIVGLMCATLSVVRQDRIAGAEKNSRDGLPVATVGNFQESIFKH